MNKKLGLNIRRIRQKRGLTQYKLAEMVKVDVSTINKIEKCKANPSLSLLYRLADVLGVSVTILLQDDEESA